MSGGGSFSSDQRVLNMTTVGADTLAKAGRMRITSIQGRGEAGSVILLHDSATTGCGCW